MVKRRRGKIPPGPVVCFLPHPWWVEFYKAARELFARHHPKSLAYWDQCARELCRTSDWIMRDPQNWAPLGNVMLMDDSRGARELMLAPFDEILRLMREPGSRRPSYALNLVSLYDRMKGMLEGLRRFRSAAGRKGAKEENAPIDLIGVYRDHLRDVYIKLNPSEKRAPPEDIVEDICNNLWKKPADAAYLLLEDITGRDYDYLVRRISVLRRGLADKNDPLLKDLSRPS